MKPHALVTNDDGIESIFLLRLVEALLVHFEVSVAAPASEQSWIGRAMSRHNPVHLAEKKGLFPESVKAWEVHGTPSDCMNIALGNLLARKPDIVISGINIGFNTSEVLILSSGTVAGAIEGIQWGLPAIAFSKCVPGDVFERIRDSKGAETSENYTRSLAAAAEHAANIAIHTLNEPPPSGTMLNVNFPASTTTKSVIEETVPAKIRLGGLFAEISPGCYQFQFSPGTHSAMGPNSDRAALERGSISRSLLDFSRIGRV